MLTWFRERVWRSRLRISLDHTPFLHHENHMFRGGDVHCRIARDGDQVGELARFDRADRLRQPEQLGIGRSRCLERGDRR